MSLYTVEWRVSSNEINIKLQLRARVVIDAAQGPARWRFKPVTTTHMNYREQSLAIAPLTSFQAIAGSMPAVTQELAGRGEPLSWNPSAVDGNSGRQIRKKPYHRRRSGKAESRRYGIDISAYEVPVIDPESTLNSQSILYRSASTPSAPTPAPSTSAISAQYLWFHLRLQHRHQYPHGPWSL